MNLSRRPLLLALPLLLWLGGRGAAAQDAEPQRVVEGQPFAVRVVVADTALQLNGTGVRAVAWFKGFAAGLYLRVHAASPAQVLAQTGPKRLQLRLLQDVPSAEFVRALKKGIERNAPDAERAALAPRVERLAEQIAAAGRVRKGDVVDLDLDPALGLLFSLNGTLRGAPIEGADFYAALLRAFIGPRPYDERLKAGLLGQAPAGPR